MHSRIDIRQDNEFENVIFKLRSVAAWQWGLSAKIEPNWVTPLGYVGMEKNISIPEFRNSYDDFHLHPNIGGETWFGI